MTSKVKNDDEENNVNFWFNEAWSNFNQNLKLFTYMVIIMGVLINLTIQM